MLSLKGLPIARPLKGQEGYVYTTKDTPVTVCPFLEGVQAVSEDHTIKDHIRVPSHRFVSGLFWDLHKQLSTFTPTVDNVPVARYRAVQACLEDINRFTYELEIAPDGKHIVDGFCIKCQESIDENQPMSEQTLVHSDFERQNVLFAPNGRVNGLLDFDALKRGSLLYEFSHTLFNFVCCDPIADKRDVDIYLEDFVKAGLLPIEDLGRIYSSMSRFCMDDLSGFLEIARKRPLDIYKIISHYERALIFAYNNLKL